MEAHWQPQITNEKFYLFLIYDMYIPAGVLVYHIVAIDALTGNIFLKEGLDNFHWINYSDEVPESHALYTFSTWRSIDAGPIFPDKGVPVALHSPQHIWFVDFWKPATSRCAVMPFFFLTDAQVCTDICLTDSSQTMSFCWEHFV